MIRIFLPLFLLMFSCKPQQQLAKVEPEVQQISKENNLETSPEVDAILAPYKKEIDEKMNKIIGQCAYEIIKAQPESALGNFCADAIHKMAEDYTGKKIDFATQNYGGMRVPYLAKGNITKGRIYELMPFENRLSIIDLPGKETLQFIQHMTNRGGWPISASLRYFIFEKKAIEITINGKPFDINQTYRIAMPDYIANGGDNCDFLIGHPRQDSERLLREAFFESILEHTFAEKAIEPRIDGRIAIRNN